MYKITLYIPVGISGQGKTTYGNKITLENNSIKMVSPETVSDVLPNDASNAEVFDAMRKQASQFMKRGFSVFFDASNLKQKYRKEVIDELKKDAEFIVGVYFPVNVETAKENNKKRLIDMSDEEINTMLESMDKISFEEGFDCIWTVY